MTIDLDEMHPSRFVQITSATVELNGAQPEVVLHALDTRGVVWQYIRSRGWWSRLSGERH